MAVIEAADPEAVQALLRPHLITTTTAAPGLIAQPGPLRLEEAPAAETFGQRSRRYRSGWFDLTCLAVLLALGLMALWA